MRRVIVNNIVSLDGFFADAEGNPTVLNMDEAFDRANLESLERADIVLLGRESFDGFSGYWPSIADAPEPARGAKDPHQYDETNRAISRRWGEVLKAVISDRGPVAESNAWHASTTVVRRDDIGGWLAHAREEGDGDILVFASHVMWNDLLARGLIDELHLMIAPNVLAEGEPLFTTPASLELLEARTFEGSSNVQLRYSVVLT